MSDATQLVELLNLSKQPVAIAFRDEAPAGIERIEQAALSGCTYWKYAAEGQSFYTEASDHYGCPVGSHTHGIDLPEAEGKQLEGLIGTMVELSYLAADEVAGIPRRQKAFGVVLYSPLAVAAFDPDVVMISGNAKQMMLLAEASHLAGVQCDSSLVGRPTCAAIPAVMESGRAAANLGCIGNRVYTEMSDDELYVAIAGSQVSAVVSKLATIVNANSELEKFHQGRFVS